MDLKFRMNRNLCRILCFMLFLQVLLSAMGISIVCSQPAVGDWVVTGEEVVEDRTIVLNGDLIVEEGDGLTLRNVRLVMNCGYDGEFNTEVRGGSVYIYNSNVTAADMEHRFAILVECIAAALIVAGIGWYFSMRSRKPAPPKPPSEVKVKPPEVKPPPKPPVKKEVLLLEELEEMYKSGKITETAYRRLKKKYKAEADSEEGAK